MTTTGWWKIAGTEHLIGDGVLDTLDEAVREIVRAYENAFERRPTREE